MMDSKCKKCRRAGQKLFLKGERCLSQKCAVIRKPYIPGVHGKARRRRISEYGQQLAEKQKIRHIYGVSEQQFKNYFKEIVGQKGNREELLVQKLENRLDNVVFRLGWTSSRSTARQVVSHGHILVNGHKVDIPSYQVKKGDVIKIRERSKKLILFQDLKTILKKHEVAKWLSLDNQKIEGKVKGQPGIEDLDKIGELSMVIEYYSK
ncbi:MAG: 30S ribosomal protein S4 [Parcubacteria group bacterium]|nr:30S ribosomal protein S4 [Parcubacteria group bacterium]|tara:strand:+ start:498 stop:1118 length:621 start_codon:yes stop_codon:yes gene_type:complete